MNNIQKWWHRFDIYAVPVVVVLFLLLGYQGGVYMTERQAATALGEKLAQITLEHSEQVKELREQLERERDTTRDKDKRLRAMQNRQLRIQEKQTDVLSSAVKATEAATKAVEKATGVKSTD